MKLITEHAQRKSRFAHAVVVMIAAGLLSGCTLLGLSPRADKSILADSPCKPPCWWGIVPGTVMNEDEIVQILRALPGTGHISIEGRLGGREVVWYWRYGTQEPPRYQNRNFIFLDNVRGAVQKITLQIAFDMTVQEILDQYGTPEGASWGSSLLIGDEMHWVVVLAYPTRGLDFRVALPWRREIPPVLEPSSRVFELTYSVPAESLESRLKRHPDLPLVPWPGYGELQSVEP